MGTCSALPPLHGHIPPRPLSGLRRPARGISVPADDRQSRVRTGIQSTAVHLGQPTGIWLAECSSSSISKQQSYGDSTETGRRRRAAGQDRAHRSEPGNQTQFDNQRSRGRQAVSPRLVSPCLASPRLGRNRLCTRASFSCGHRQRQRGSVAIIGISLFSQPASECCTCRAPLQVKCLGSHPSLQAPT